MNWITILTYTVWNADIKIILFKMLVFCKNICYNLLINFRCFLLRIKNSNTKGSGEMLLKNKTVILGVTGSIAAYKMANVASMLVKMGCDVHVIMTKNATNFITPTTFETLTNNKCLVDTFDRNFQFHVAHISIAEKADVALIAPASANCIGKLAYGIADDMLTTTIMACKAKKIIAPAMNSNMFENSIVQENLAKLGKHGYEIIQPDSGFLACRAVGSGKLPKEEVLVEHILKEIAYEKDLLGTNILVTAGATSESIDPVRYITNHSTGKMGYALAKSAMLRGANVTLVSGSVSVEKPPFVNFISVVSAEDMFNAVVDNFSEMDIVIKAAAVADYTPESVATEKVKKVEGVDSMSIPLKRTKDILQYLGANCNDNQFLCGFSMETENMIENSRKKLIKKNIDLIVANNLKVAGSGFATDTNIVTLISKEEEIALDIMSKDEVAHNILNQINKMRKKQ